MFHFIYTQTEKGKYILDYRDVSPLVAFAVTCVAYVSQSFDDIDI